MRLCRSLQDHFVTSLIRAMHFGDSGHASDSGSQAEEPSVARPSPTRHSQRAKRHSFRVAHGTKRPTLGTQESHAWLFFIGTWLFFTEAWDSVEPGMALFHRRLGLFPSRVGLFGRRLALFVWSDPLQRPDQRRSRWPPAFTRGETRFSPTPQCFFDLQARRRLGLAGTLRRGAGQAGRLS